MGCGNSIQAPRGFYEDREIFDACCRSCVLTKCAHHDPECTQYNNKAIILYHVTNQNVIPSIRKSGKLKRGSAGAYGAGIYLCTHDFHCKTKCEAQPKWYVVVCSVKMGNPRKMNSVDHGITLSGLQKDGFDSVYTTRGPGGGPYGEYVVYSWNQVELVSTYKWPEGPTDKYGYPHKKKP